MKVGSWRNWIVIQPERVLLKAQVEALAPKVIGSMLDVGGGDGRRYRNCFNAASYICLDRDESLNPDVCASAEEMPFEDSVFDFIFSSQMLEHVERPDRALKEMYRVLKKGGLGLITVPFINELHSEPHDYWRFTMMGLSKILREAGFEILEISQRGSYPSTIAQLRIRRLIEKTNCYESKNWLLVVTPISIIYTKFCLLLDSMYRSKSSRKFALGYAFLVRK